MLTRDYLKEKKVLIVGLGKSGLAALYALCPMGAKVYVQDSKKKEELDAGLVEYIDNNCAGSFLGKMPDNITTFDMMVLSPGVDPEKDFVVEAKKAGCDIVGELELAYRLAKGTFIGITGTNGKTTTTTLVGEIFKASGRKTNVVGNIGEPVITASLKSTDEDWMITEVSSFQLQTTTEFKPYISAILNLTPDHLNRHHTMEGYGAAKARIWENQDENGVFIINADDPVLNELCYKTIMPQPKAKIIPFSRVKELEYGAFLLNDSLVYKKEDGTVIEFCKKQELKIIGNHNIENALAAALMASCAGIDRETIREVLISFKGVEHRIEFCGEKNGVRFYNDSKGTNVDAAVIALKAIEKNIILIAGGDSKGQEFDDLIDYFPGRVKHMVLLGRDAHFISEACERKGFSDFSFHKDMEECVRAAFEMAEPGDTVLLSPACASWDMYKNFEARGDHFKNIVKEL